jgi:putative tributyrin esterase
MSSKDSHVGLEPLSHQNVRGLNHKRYHSRGDFCGQSCQHQYSRENKMRLKMNPPRLVSVVLFLLMLVLCQACGQKSKEAEAADHPQLTDGVVMQDIRFRSQALGREMVYRVILPKSIPASAKLPVLYLLHGGGGGYRDWSNYSDVSRYAEHGWMLVMPEGNSSYYTNAAERPEDRYEDYIVKDLIADVANRFPAATGGENRAIAGVSMGGYGAIKIALKFPELYSFAAGISPALDVPTRPFSVKRIAQWKFHRSIFGAWGSQTQHDNDPYLLAQSAVPSETPYLFFTCGEQEGLLPANQRFAKELAARGIAFEFQTAPGDHNWKQWDQRISEMFASLSKQFN